MIKISVIIPVYNVEAYLNRCLDSVCNQTLSDIEIICVDDCSPDNSIDILNQYAKTDSRIKIIQKDKNGGLSAARNSGLDIAKGDYIYFLDSDDWIDLDYLDVMYNAAINHDVEVVVNDNVISEKKGSSIPYNHISSKDFTNNTLLNAMENIDKILWNVWSKLYKKSFIDKHNFKFPEGYINEDLYFQLITFPYLNNIAFIKESNYHYLDRENGIMNTNNDKEISIIKIYDIVYDFYKQHNLLDKKVKLLAVMPYFKIDSEEKYNTFKSYFTKAEDYINKNAELFNDLEKFFINNILNTSSYNDYIQKFQTSVTISFIRRQK